MFDWEVLMSFSTHQFMLQSNKVSERNDNFHITITGFKNTLGEFLKHGIDLEFVETPHGTGEIVEKLRDQELDVCTVLTEGMLKAIGHNENQNC
jgi:hypothetical protein